MMEKTYKLEITDFKACRMIGKKIIVTLGKTARKHWQKFLNDGSNEFLQKLECKLSPAGECIGWMGDYDSKTKTFTEMPGVFAVMDSEVPNGYDSIDIPDCKMAILWIEGNTSNLEKGAHNLLLKYLNETDYAPDYSLGFSMEYYTSVGYVSLDKDNPIYKFGYFLPCKTK